MKALADSSVVKFQIGLLVLLLGLMLKGTWSLSEIAFKVDVLWSERPRPMAINTHKESNP